MILGKVAVWILIFSISCGCLLLLYWLTLEDDIDVSGVFALYCIVNSILMASLAVYFFIQKGFL